MKTKRRFVRSTELGDRVILLPWWCPLCCCDPCRSLGVLRRELLVIYRGLLFLRRGLLVLRDVETENLRAGKHNMFYCVLVKYLYINVGITS